MDSKSAGGLVLDVTTGATVYNIAGVLDLYFGTWSIMQDFSPAPSFSGLATYAAVPAPQPYEFTVAGFNVERFYDTANDPGTSDVVMTQAGFDLRLNKASLAIRDVLLMPDIIGIEEMESMAALQALADKVNADAGTPGNYWPYSLRQ